MEITPIVVALIQNVPVAVSFGFAVVVAVVTFWLNWKKVDVEGVTSVSTMHISQIKSLIDQIELLSKELKEARGQLHAIHVQNVQLMEQLRASNRRIGELELLLEG